MAIVYRPQGDLKSYDLIRSFRPAGSQTVVWAQDMSTGRLLRLLRWGNEIYLPVRDGMSLGIGVFNGSDNYRAYPMYIEGRNMWDRGHAQPEFCSVDHMWELRPGERQVFDKLMNPDRQAGRPLIVTASGFGSTIGEATFHTDEFRGQLRVYERLPLGGGFQQERKTNQGQGLKGVMGDEPPYRDEWRGATRGLESNTRGGSSTYGAKGIGSDRGRAGIGAGHETHQGHDETGVVYQQTAQPVVFFRVEYQDDLQPMLDVAWGRDIWSWYEPLPMGNRWWDDQSWSWRQSRPTAPEVPVTPHRPRR